MKRTLATFLTLAMLLICLAGCGGNAEPPAPEKDTPEGAPAEVPAEAPAETDIEPLTIKFSAAFNENETAGTILKHFMEKLDELSGGAITVDVAWGGTLFPSADELDAVMDGAVNMIALGHMPHVNTLTYLAFPGFHPDGVEEAVAYFNTLMFDDPETSAIIQGQATELGIKYLNVLANGANAFCATYPFEDLDSLVEGSTSFANFNAALYEQLGFQVTVLPPPDIYDALNRGLVDGSLLGFDPMISMGWYEVAPYWAMGATYSCGNFYTVNLDWWDTLSPAQQEAIQAAAKDAEKFSVSLVNDSLAANIEKVETETGNKMVYFDQEDLDTIWAATFDAGAQSALFVVAGDEEATENQITILKKCAELTHYDWDPEQVDLTASAG